MELELIYTRTNNINQKNKNSVLKKQQQLPQQNSK